jgi:hypothetical protein
MAKSEFDFNAWKAEFDLRMEQIFKDIAETKRIHDNWDEEREPRERHLHLVPAIEDDNDG